MAHAPSSAELDIDLGTFLDALDTAGIGLHILRHDAEGPTRVYLNDSAASLLGRTLAEVYGQPPLAFVAPEERAKLAELERAQQRGEPLPDPLEAVIERPNGTRVRVEVHLARIELRGIPYSFVFLNDLTPRAEVEQRLRASELRFRQLAEAAPDTITVIADGEFVYANPAAVRLLGFDSMEELCARPLTELLSPEEAALMFQRMQQSRQGVKLEPREYTAHRKDGSGLTMEISSIPTEFEGRPAVLAHGRDTTERKRLQAELLQAERMATVGALVAGVAHEINNPLTYLLIHLERLQHELPGLVGPAEARANTARILDESLEAAQRVRDIVRDLLAFARSDSAVTGAPLPRHEHGARVEQALETAIKLAHALLKTSARLHRDFGATSPVAASEARLVQVFINLLVNAAQAIASAEAPGRTGEIAIRTFESDGRVVVEVSDDGPGVATTHVQQIFDSFFTTKEPEHGTGLGLAISRSIVESMGGDITAENRPEGGLLVRLSLPPEPPHGAAAPASDEPARAQARTTGQRRASILVVDDEPLVARALTQLLGKHDFQVASHTDPGDALERLRESELFDLVFCDINMPRLSGADLYVAALDAHPEYASRFIFITGGAMTDRAARIVSDAAAPVLEKPFSADDVIRMARLVLGPAD